MNAMDHQLNSDNSGFIHEIGSHSVAGEDMYVHCVDRGNSRVRHTADDLRQDEPDTLALYLYRRKSSSPIVNRWILWAKGYLHNKRKNVRRIRDLNVYFPVENHPTPIVFDSVGPKHSKKIRRMQKAVNNKKREHKYKYGVMVPNTYIHALALDFDQNETEWNASMRSELTSVNDFNTFEIYNLEDKDQKRAELEKIGYSCIPLHMIFDVKQCGRHKSRLVAGGHRMKDVDQYDTYCSNVKTKSLRYLFAIAQLNSYEVISCDIKNAYLHAKSSAKCFTVLGKEYAACGMAGTGHLARIDKALYGLPTSGADWHAYLAKVLHDLGYKQTWADKDVWMRLDTRTNTYEYAASYTDDLLFFSNDPTSQLAQITGKSDKFGGFKIKGGEGPTYHLGIDYEKVTINGESFFKMTSETFAGEAMRKLETIKLALDPKRYSRKSVQYHKGPIPEGYMPENDTSEKLGLVEHRMF